MTLPHDSNYTTLSNSKKYSIEMTNYKKDKNTWFRRAYLLINPFFPLLIFFLVYDNFSPFPVILPMGTTDSVLNICLKLCQDPYVPL